MSLNAVSRRRFPKVPKAVWIALGVIVLVIVAVFACQKMKPDPAAKDPYREAAVERGDITRSVSASGSLQALVTVDVGSQISGQVTRVLVDFNDEVRAGQTLAVLDPSTFQSRVAQSQADINAGEASVRQAQATLANAQADYARKKSLVDQGWSTPAALDQANAALRSGQAAVSAARARVVQSQAALRIQRTDLGRTTISSPIDGVVVDRKVEPGATVAASLQAPVLFTIAQDLSKVEVKISVDEADVGQVQEGQRVRFTVDAFPDDNFTGIVTQVRKQPTTEQNVVAYTVIAEADNPQGKLLPGMTANADIILETKRNVLKVPASALRWQPADMQQQRAGGGGMTMGPPGFGGGPPGGGQRQQGGGGRGGAGRIVEQLDLDKAQAAKWEQIQVELRQKMAAAMASAGGDRTKMRETMRKNTEEAFAKLEPTLKPEQKQKLVALRATMSAGGRGRDGTRGGVVYVLREGKPTPIPVRVGATDGSSTEIVTRQLKPGDNIITGGGPRPKAQVRSPLGGGPPGGGGGQRGGGGGAAIRM